MKSHDVTRFIPVTEWSSHHPWPPIGGLRHLIFYSKDNGFERVVRRIGRRVLIDEANAIANGEALPDRADPDTIGDVGGQAAIDALFGTR